MKYTWKKRCKRRVSKALCPGFEPEPVRTNSGDDSGQGTRLYAVPYSAVLFNERLGVGSVRHDRKTVKLLRYDSRGTGGDVLLFIQ